MLCYVLCSACRNATAVLAQLDDVCRGKSQKMYNEDMKFTSFRSSKVPFDVVECCIHATLILYALFLFKKHDTNTVCLHFHHVKSIVHKYN
jgi:hypothetical protein